jgi:hypothetical protein
LGRHSRTPRTSKLALLAGTGVLTVLAASAVTAATWPQAQASAAHPPASVTRSSAPRLATLAISTARHAPAPRKAPLPDAALPDKVLPDAPAGRYAPVVAITRPKPAPVRHYARQATVTSVTSTGAAPSGTPQEVARGLLGAQGQDSQFYCLDALWDRESGWNVYASNPGTGAYGIPQALPGSKMASAGLDWAGDAETQIQWGLGYIDATYGSPCAAWGHEEATGWY